MSRICRTVVTRAVVAVVAVAVLAALTSCGGAKLSVADEQYALGEYFEAQKTYRKVYNKLTKKEERPQRGMVAYKMGLCYDRLGMSARASSAFANALRYEYPDSTNAHFSCVAVMGRSVAESLATCFCNAVLGFIAVMF